jgi:hypothetical protein
MNHFNGIHKMYVFSPFRPCTGLEKTVLRGLHGEFSIAVERQIAWGASYPLALFIQQSAKKAPAPPFPTPPASFKLLPPRSAYIKGPVVIFSKLSKGSPLLLLDYPL